MLNELVMPRIDDAPESEYTIGELAARYGLSYRTLRFYEQRGLLCPTRKGTQRVYSGRDRIRLEIIMLAKRLGFTLTEVSDLVQARFGPLDALDAPPTVMSLGLSKEQIGAQVAHLARERESLQRSIEELREAASRIEGSASGG